MYASNHFIIWHIKRNCFDIMFIIDRILGKYGDEVCLPEKF